MTGSFNKWNEDLFKMDKTGNGWEFTLKMKPDAYQYRYIVDGQWMEDPNNSNKAENEFGEYNSIIDIKAYTTFKLKGYTEAKNVILAGSFNNWNEQAMVMRKMDYGWKYVIPLSGGKHHYKFIVDGKWMEDPNNAHKVYNEHHTFNSILTIKKTVTFELKGYKNAENVVLTGSFNNWDGKDLPMKKIDDKWLCTLTLKGGKHHYKYIVDGKWIVDPDNTIKERDEYGNINSVKMVE